MENSETSVSGFMPAIMVGLIGLALIGLVYFGMYLDSGKDYPMPKPISYNVEGKTFHYLLCADGSVMPIYLDACGTCPVE